MQNIVTNPYNEYRTRLTLSFVKNNGQEDSRALFTTSHKGRRFFFSTDRITSVELEPIEEPPVNPEFYAGLLFPTLPEAILSAMRKSL